MHRRDICMNMNEVRPSISLVVRTNVNFILKIKKMSSHSLAFALLIVDHMQINHVPYDTRRRTLDLNLTTDRVRVRRDEHIIHSNALCKPSLSVLYGGM